MFKLSSSGTETVLHSFEGGTDGAYPEAGLIADSSGNLYGTTRNAGGAPGYGTVFKLSPGGTETVLYSFTGGSDGVNPTASLIADSSGNLYGTTARRLVECWRGVQALAERDRDGALHLLQFAYLQRRG